MFKAMSEHAGMGMGIPDVSDLETMEDKVREDDMDLTEFEHMEKEELQARLEATKQKVEETKGEILTLIKTADSGLQLAQEEVKENPDMDPKMKAAMKDALAQMGGPVSEMDSKIAKAREKEKELRKMQKEHDALSLALFRMEMREAGTPVEDLQEAAQMALKAAEGRSETVKSALEDAASALGELSDMDEKIAQAMEAAKANKRD